MFHSLIRKEFVIISSRLLVFPMDMDDAAPFLRFASSLGIEIIGASSAMDGPGALPVNHFIRLPFVTQASFDSALKEAIRRYGITKIFCPHQGVWRHLENLLQVESRTFNFYLCKPDPLTATCDLLSNHQVWAESVLRSTVSESIAGVTARQHLSRSSYAALHRLFLSTPGESDDGKLQALCDIARLLPPGDLLEIGCLYGRSALALGYLAGRHQIGNVICVDPWKESEIEDQGVKASLLNSERINFDFERLFHIFLSTAAMFENIGYIRQAAETALPIYEAARQTGSLVSPQLGRISLTPHLSLLHIDGNHRYDHVLMDVQSWSPYLTPGGWLLIDDYVWAFGDGPRRVGDELIESSLFDTSFVSSDTLFLRRSEH